MTGVQEPQVLSLLFLADDLVLQVHMLQLGQRTEKLNHVSMTKDGRTGQAELRAIRAAQGGSHCCILAP